MLKLIDKVNVILSHQECYDCMILALFGNFYFRKIEEGRSIHYKLVSQGETSSLFYADNEGRWCKLGEFTDQQLADRFPSKPINWIDDLATKG